MRFSFQSNSPVSWITNKFVLLGASILVLIFFGDILLPWLGHILFILLEAVEEALDVLLETVFALTPRSAQMVVAWIGLVLLVYGLVVGIHKIQYFIRYDLIPKVSDVHDQLQASPRWSWLLHPWAIPMLFVFAVGSSVLAFF